MTTENDIKELIEIREDLIDEEIYDILENNIFMESNTANSEKYLQRFYEHLIKCIIQPDGFKQGWIDTLNHTREGILDGIRRKGSININDERNFLKNVEKSFQKAIKENISLYKKYNRPELVAECENFKMPSEFKDIKNFIFNKERLKKYILSSIPKDHPKYNEYVNLLDEIKNIEYK